MASTLLEMAAQILTAHAGNNQMSSEELIKELHEIHASLKALESPESLPTNEVAKAVISGKQSIKKNEIVCLICNKGGFKTLARHLNTTHGIKPKDYKKQFDIPAKQSLSARSLSETRKKSALDRGLAENLAKARATRTANIEARKQTPPKKTATKAKETAPAKKR